MIARLLIASRGEIVCRIAQTAHRMGVSTIGLYSEADKNSVHVDAVDVAVALGGSTPRDSYMRADSIIEAALTHGADAVHPGYGFLAERADVARAVIDAGLRWVGPTPEQIELLGDKLAAKTAAVAAGVPTTTFVEVAPGTAPAGLTMPVLVKAAAGGGGRGIRIVRQHIDLAAAIDGASREAEAVFGDGRVFIEPYIERARHVEVQIIGDSFGTIVHLGERECSIQRRNQKIIEEAPSPGISGEVRDRLTKAAIDLANEVGYENAGAVEFLVGEDETINFLEVNTRLQVEHPVTEAVTGLDLVELQLRVAAGEALPIRQSDVEISGHAIDVRIVAEDPANDWLPSIGEVKGFEIGEGTRVHVGINVGSAVTPEYDSMLAKVMAHAPTRAEAAAIMARSLQGSAIAGVRTNLSVATAIMLEPDFLAGATLTKYLAEHADLVENGGLAEDVRDALLVAATLALEGAYRSENTVRSFASSGERNVRTQGQRRIWLHDRHEVFVEYTLRDDLADMMIGPWPSADDEGALPEDRRTVRTVRVLRREGPTLAIELDGLRLVCTLLVDSSTVYVASALGAASFELVPPSDELV